MRRGPMTLRMPPNLASRGFCLGRVIAALGRVRGLDNSDLQARFACTPRERRFVQHLLRAHTNLWVFRVNQRGFAGDFALIDMSERDPARRRAVVVELKRGEPVRTDFGRSHQLRNHRAVVTEIADTGALAPEVQPDVLQGDREAVLEHLGLRPIHAG